MKIKKLILPSFLSLSLLASCGGPSNVTVSGSVDSQMNGKFLKVRNLVLDSVIDSIQVQDGKFTYTTQPAESTEIILLGLYNDEMPSKKAIFIPEAGDIKLDTAWNPHGSPMNDQMTNDILIPFDQLMQEGQNIEDSVSMVRLMEKVKDLRGKLATLFYANSDNSLGYEAFLRSFQLAETNSDIFPLLDKAGERLKATKLFKQAISDREVLEKTLPGKMFIDFESTDWNDKSVKLSDYVGKGKYTLVDFWASWCGPCRKQIPFVAEANKKYASKGLTVIGVDVRDTKEGFDKVSQQLKVVWPQIRDDKWEFARMYGISGIPQIILFGPDGKILARDLHSEKIEQEIQKYIK